MSTPYANYYLGEDYKRRVKELVDLTRYRDSEIVRLGLDLLSVQMGLDPVTPLPKASAPAR